MVADNPAGAGRLTARHRILRSCFALDVSAFAVRAVVAAPAEEAAAVISICHRAVRFFSAALCWSACGWSADFILCRQERGGW